MKNLNFNPAKNSIRLLICLFLVTISTEAFSRNKLGAFVDSHYYIIPVAFVTGLAIFLFTLFIKQKNH